MKDFWRKKSNNAKRKSKQMIAIRTDHLIMPAATNPKSTQNRVINMHWKDKLEKNVKPSKKLENAKDKLKSFKRHWPKNKDKTKD